ncbi:DUF4325 domain-containing protein [Candidatus Saccharibacteria bacterium]|nr:DUF4325 domain-containing protein [Candidatus Saccharibacteria bacterium]
MNTREKVYILLKNSKKELSVSDIVQKIATKNRTYISKCLSELQKSHKLESRKSGRQIFYKISETEIYYEENLDFNSIHDEEIWKAIKISLPDNISENTENILFFAFSEMLNNAIDHSKSNYAYVKVWREKDTVKFIVEDKGIGVFRSLMSKKGYKDEIEAIGELVKGKVTTAPKWHSGEGIFWTSKIADRFALSSFNYRLTIDTVIDDYAIELLDESERIFGTKVQFEIELATQKSLMHLFEKYSLNRETYSFDTTMIPVKLYQSGEVWISRSQAKRILSGLEKYRKIIFDFKGIKIVGQAFVDEIFRVFSIHHPEIELEPINMNKSVKMMVERALSDQTGRD